MSEETTTPGPGPGPDPAADVRHVVLTLATAAALLLALGALNVAVDPRADFGTGLVRPLVKRHRARRARDILSPFQEKPGLLALGSSRVWKLEPAFLKERTGLPAFVAGFDDARAEDHLTFARYVFEGLNLRPKLVLVQVDVAAFHPETPTSSQLLRDPRLSAHLPDDIPIWDRLQAYLDAISFPLLLDSIRALRLEVVGHPQEDVRILENGFVIYQIREAEIRAGVFDLHHHIHDTTEYYIRIYRDFDHLSARRLASMEDLADLCARHGARLVIYLPPMHREQAEAMRRRTRQVALAEGLKRAMEALAERPGVSFHDMSRLELFGGDPELFYDGVHLREENNRRLIDRLLEREPSLALQ